MLNNFFRINLPYGIARNEKGEWMAFNRDYLPLGFNDHSLISEHNRPGISYFEYPIYTKYNRVSEKFLIELVASQGSVQRNDKGDIVFAFLYTDKTNPSKNNKPALWNAYFEKLQKLSKLGRDENR